MTPTTQFRIPSNLKSMFKDVCAYRNVSMCQIVIQCVERYIGKETQDPALIRHLRAKETQRQTGLMLDKRGVWVKPESIEPDENDWRTNL